MSQVCTPLMISDIETMPEEYPEWMTKTPEVDDVDYFLAHGLDEALSKKVSAMIEAQADLLYWGPETKEAEVDIIDWATGINPEHDPENYTCWKYEEYKEYMRETFSYIPNSFWKCFNYDDMLLQMWKDQTYEIIYYDGNELMLLEDAPPQEDIGEWFKDHPEKSKFFVLQYGIPPVHPWSA